MNILIIGSEGFIGSNLQQYFSHKGYSVWGADIFEQPASNKYSYIKVTRLSFEWDDLFKITTFEACINAAGSGNVSYSVNHPLIDFESNVLDVIKILDTLRKYQHDCKYLHISSAAVYGNPVSLPISEADYLNPVSPYGFHKLISEQICKEYYLLFGIKIAIIRPFSVYGVGLRKQLLWDVCQKIYQSDNKSIALYGTGMESRDFIYIDDLVALIDVIISKSPFQNDIYNAASGTETTIAEIATEIEKGIPGVQISFSGIAREGDPINWCADVEKISRLGFKQTITMKEGIQKYLDWFIVKNLHEI